MESHVHFLESLIARGGPTPEEYPVFSDWINRLAEAVASGKLTKAEVLAFARQVVTRHLPGTFWHHVLTKPHGYDGDFEIIDAMYRQAIHPDPRLARWDEYYHSEAAPRAVCNRKTYLHQQLARLCVANPHRPLRMLNIGSGPARDLKEWFDQHGSGSLQVDCVEMSAKAITYSQQLCKEHAHSLRHFQANALRFTTDERYDLVWSAGLFDYLNDGLFVRLLKRLIRFARFGGEVIVGNFGDQNPTRNYMELLGDWTLFHRSADRLRDLANHAGASGCQVSIGAEPAGVNLFLHVIVP